MSKWILSLCCAPLLASCSSVSIDDYKETKPHLVLENYLNGHLEAHGMFQDRTGKVVKSFFVDMNAHWKGNIGTLEEDFKYSDGTTSRRVWTIVKEPDGSYSGTASDVIGKAQGKSAGNAFHWNYTLDLPVGDTSYHVQFDDWMYLMNDKVMLNKSRMSKLGFYLGEVTLSFYKKEK